MMTVRTRFCSLCLVLGFVLSVMFSGCHTARMAVPSELKAASEMKCSGRGGFHEEFQFGPYKVTDVSRGWTKRTAWGFWKYEKATVKQNYEFSLLTPAGKQWHGQAAAGLKAADIKTEAWGGELTVGIKSEHNLVVRLGSSDGAKWTMVLNQDSGESLFRGVFTDGTEAYSVAGTHKLAGSPMPLSDASGYILIQNGKQVAAVEVINAGAVWLSSGLTSSQQDALSAAATALLLFKDLSAGK